MIINIEIEPKAHKNYLSYAQRKFITLDSVLLIWAWQRLPVLGTYEI